MIGSSPLVFVSSFVVGVGFLRLNRARRSTSTVESNQPRHSNTLSTTRPNNYKRTRTLFDREDTPTDFLQRLFHSSHILLSYCFLISFLLDYYYYYNDDDDDDDDFFLTKQNKQNIVAI